MSDASVSHSDVADPRRVRASALIDGFGCLFLTMLALPQPVLRQALLSGRPPVQGVLLFVASLLVPAVVLWFVYLAVCATVWSRTIGMWLLDLRLDGTPSLASSLAWAAGWSVAWLPGAFGSALAHPATGLPARLSGRATVATSGR